MDTRRFFLLWRKNWISVIIAMAMGAILGAGMYEIYYLRATAEPVFEKEANFYVIAKEVEVYHLFNAYTWADEIKKNDVMDIAMEALLEEHPETDITKEEMKNAMTADVPSDLRFLQVKVRSSSPDRAEAILLALNKGIVCFPNFTDLDEVNLISIEDTIQIQKENLISHAAVVGLLLGLIFWIAGYGIYYALDDRICVENDVAKVSDVIVLGYRTRNEDSFWEELLSANLKKANANDLSLLQVSKKADWSKTLEKNQGGKMILAVDFHKTSQKSFQFICKECQKFEVEPVGILIQNADDRFLKGYYR